MAIPPGGRSTVEIVKFRFFSKTLFSLFNPILRVAKVNDRSNIPRVSRLVAWIFLVWTRRGTIG